MVSSKTVHSCYEKPSCSEKRIGTQYGKGLGAWHFLMPLAVFFSFMSTRSVHMNTESNKHLDWLACSLILRRTHNLTLMQCFELKLRILTITEIVFSCWWRWTGSTWVVTEIERVSVQTRVLVDFIALDIIEKQIYVR